MINKKKKKKNNKKKKKKKKKKKCARRGTTPQRISLPAITPELGLSTNAPARGESPPRSRERRADVLLEAPKADGARLKSIGRAATA